MRALELFAGIGGLGLAAPPGSVIAAFDQDREAGRTHARNHGVPVFPLDLATVRAPDLLRHDADAWLLSPPCQPFTRRGRGRDVDDPRCAGLLRLVSLLPECRPSRVLVENVRGFHGSRAHGLLVHALVAIGHDVADVEACPTQLDAPVRRPRQFVVSSRDGLAGAPPPPAARAPSLGMHLDEAPDPELRLPPDLLARVADHPCATPDGVAATFTRSYGRALTGAGSLLRDAGGVRYFSPEEILRLHGFPRPFAFPEDLGLRTRWRLAGNSVHVGSVRHVMSRLGVAA